MKFFLLVFNDVILLSIFKRWAVRSSLKENLLFAKNAEKAIEILNSTPVDLVITTFKLAEMDGLELIAEISSHYPTVKTAFFLPPNFPIEIKHLNHLSSLYFVLKPNSLKEFLHFIGDSCLSIAEIQALPVSQIAIGDFLQLIEYQEKTCVLEVANSQSQQKTAVYFKEGMLYDAVACENNHANFASTIALQSYLSVDLTQVCAEFNSSTLMAELLAWKQVKMQFKPFDASAKTVHRTLFVSIVDLLNGKT